MENIKYGKYMSQALGRLGLVLIMVLVRITTLIVGLLVLTFYGLSLMPNASSFTLSAWEWVALGVGVQISVAIGPRGGEDKTLRDFVLRPRTVTTSPN